MHTYINIHKHCISFMHRYTCVRGSAFLGDLTHPQSRQLTWTHHGGSWGTARDEVFQGFGHLQAWHLDVAVPELRQTRRYIGICLAFVVWAILTTLYYTTVDFNWSQPIRRLVTLSCTLLNLSAPCLQCANAQHAKSSSPTGSVANKLPGRHVAFPDPFAFLQGVSPIWLSASSLL